MTTKDQERKALEQIRKIVAGLGEDSYIGTAFEGCFEIAEENIDNDWGCSMKQTCELNEKEAEKWMDKCHELEAGNRVYENRIKELEERAANAQDRIDGWIARYHDSEDAAVENGRIAREAQSRIAELEDEIIRLKAKLYDMMVGA